MARHAGADRDLLAMARYELDKARIDTAIAEIRTKFGHRVSNVPANLAPKTRTLSAAARKRIGDAQRQRWAAVRKAAAKKTKPVVKVAPQKAATAAS